MKNSIQLEQLLHSATRLTFGMVFLCMLTFAVQGNDDASPNVVFILVDDLGWKDVGYSGSEFYETPNIDKLAKSGMVFTNGYASCPVCSPTRASIFTGKSPIRLGITTYINQGRGNQPEKWNRNTRLLPAEYVDRMPLQEFTMAESFKEAGYATCFAGKWHLGPEGFWPEDQGFDVNHGGIERGGPYGGNKYFSPYGNPRLSDGPDGEHLPDRLAEETNKFMEDHKDEPFLAVLSFYSVHTPLMARDDLKNKYEDKLAGETVDRPIWGTEGNRKLRLVQQHATYAGMVEAMDQAVGKVLDKLEELKIADRTIVVFTSDNGGLSTSEGHPTSNLPLRAGKGWTYEGGIRVPLVIHWPGITKGQSECSEPVVSMDFYPTLLECCGLEPKPIQHVDGVSIVPLLKGEAQKHGPLYWHFPHYGNQGGPPSAAIRDGDWKLVWRFEDDNFELYNLTDDISEQDNLISEENQSDRVKSLKSKLHSWLDEGGAKMPTKNPNFEEGKSAK